MASPGLVGMCSSFWEGNPADHALVVVLRSSTKSLLLFRRGARGNVLTKTVVVLRSTTIVQSHLKRWERYMGFVHHCSLIGMTSRVVQTGDSDGCRYSSVTSPVAVRIPSLKQSGESFSRTRRKCESAGCKPGGPKKGAMLWLLGACCQEPKSFILLKACSWTVGELFLRTPTSGRIC